MSEGWTRPGFEAVARFLGARTGLAFAPIRRADAETGIQRAMARARVADVGHYLASLAAGDVAIDDLVDELTVGETYFFREPAHFDLVAHDILPDLLGRRDRGHALRIWSAGCASGEEAHSLAIVVEKAGLAERASILGTDICRAALARARAASYGRWSLRGVSDELVLRYFRKTQDRWVLDERIAGRVAFEFLNLAGDAYPSLVTRAWGMDLILCRNVLIYFDPQTITSVARRLHATLADGGWLLTGPSDPPLGDEAPFETIVRPEGIHYRKAAARARVFLASAVDPIEPLAAPPPPAEQSSQPPAAEQSSQPPAPRIRALANLAGSEVAERAIATEVERHPLSAELHFLHAILLQDLGRDLAAVRAVKHVLYLDRSLAVAHFLLGSILRRLGDIKGARRAFQNARDLADRLPAAETLALGEGECAGDLALAAAAELALLAARTEVSS